MNTVKLQITLDLETNGDTEAEELGWLLNMLRNELALAPNWKGKVRGVKIVSPKEPANHALTAAR